MPPSCPFCAYARGGEIPVELIAEREDWLAFFPLKPAVAGHTLVIPREHVVDFWQLEPSLAGLLSIAVLEVGQAIRDGLRPSGMNLISSAGEVAEQTVEHVHLHLVPRWRGDALGPIWPVDGEGDSADLAKVADRVRRALG